MPRPSTRSRTPARRCIYAALRVALTAVLAYWSAVKLPGQLGVPPELGGVGITATTGLAAWIEYLLLRRSLTRRIGRVGLPARTMAILWGSAVAAGAVGLGIKRGLTALVGPIRGVEAEWHGGLLAPPALHPILTAALVLIPYGVLYFALTTAFRIPESQAVVRRVLRLGRKG